MAGVSLAACVDFEADAIETLRLNPHCEDTDLYCADISSLDLAPIKRRMKAVKGRPRIVIGGPPCQPFSKNGYWVKNENRLAHDDPRNMIGQYFRVVEELKPDGFILENVESLLHPTNRTALEEIEASAQQLGYHFKRLLVNAADYGVPQRRKRVFVIGSRRRFRTHEPTPTHAAPGSQGLFNQLPPHPGVGSFIAPFAGDEFFEPQEVAVGGTYYKELTQVPAGQNYIALSANAGYPNPRFVAGKRFWNFLLKLHPDQPSWTIAAQPGPWVGPFHWDNRRLRLREVAAIQTFPADYRFFGKRRSVQKQLGNAVPPLLGKAMVAFLLEQFSR